MDHGVACGRGSICSRDPVLLCGGGGGGGGGGGDCGGGVGGGMACLKLASVSL